MRQKKIITKKCSIQEEEDGISLVDDKVENIGNFMQIKLNSD